MDPSKFVIMQINDINGAFQRDAVKNESRDIDIFANHSSSSSRSETDFDHKLSTDYYKQNEGKLDAKNLNTEHSGGSKFLQNLSTSTCNGVVIKNDEIDIFYEDIKRETPEEELREHTGFCERCYQSFDNGTDFFKPTSYVSECSCTKQNELNESLFYNIHGEDMTLDMKTSFPTTDLSLNQFDEQDGMIYEDEVTKKRDSTAIPLRISVLSIKNEKELKRKSFPERLENDFSVAKKEIHCQICSKSFNSKNYINIHMRIHTGEKPFYCKICSKSFSQMGNLKVHERCHTGGKPFHCKICSKSFSQTSHLKVHEKRHTSEKSFHCEICSKSFIAKNEMNVHMRIHTDEKPFRCKICTKSFNTKNEMKVHMRIHTNEKPFHCKICSKSFSQMGRLKVHERCHTGEKPFCCKICSKSFSQMETL